MRAFLTRQMSGFTATYRRELSAYFATPMAYVFLAVFLLALGLFTWEAARFFDTGVADLQPFFAWHPWLYMIFLPALAMRLWADERAAGTDELLLSLPLGLPGLVWFAVATLLLCWWFFSYRRTGREMYAIGGKASAVPSLPVPLMEPSPIKSCLYGTPKIISAEILSVIM